MDWFTYIIIGILIFIFLLLPFIAGIKLSQFIHRDDERKMLSTFEEVIRAQAIDRMNYLNVLRREIANQLIERDLEAFKKLYKNVRKNVYDIKKLHTTKRKEILNNITKKYKLFSDFDIIGTKDYVLYKDAFEIFSTEEIEEAYKDIIIFQELKILEDKYWNDFDIVIDKKRDYDYFQEYIKKVSDKKFKYKIKDAMKLWYAWRQGQDEPDKVVYETNEIMIKMLPKAWRTCYGIYFKDTNEYGIYEIYDKDDEDELFESFYKSDKDFEKEEPII